MSERVAVVKVKRKSIKQAIKFNWKATGLAEVCRQLVAGFKIYSQKWAVFEIKFEIYYQMQAIKLFQMEGFFRKKFPVMSNFIFAWAKIFDHFQGLLKMGYGCIEIVAQKLLHRNCCLEMLHAKIFCMFLAILNCNFILFSGSSKLGRWRARFW